ncbi:FecR family protein [Roseibacterium sp. SDUM158016]|uniref:FecR family protein n=1 Tax=Roseicyclus sediminis TaxID=2980997 RepID=UPI0021D05C27|nr:FecR family protein [Roseibacterium sp. SDUM158016]MCU4653314.1 FecR family protein [Roseibacterium sp. SDUM158016]
MNRLRKTPLAALLLATALGLPALSQEIGTVASSEPTLRGTPPGAGTRTLALGTDVVADETVQSSATGRGQLLFLDQTTLSLAPNTTIVLDRFVFDPNRGTGEIGLQLTEGALRFIGGTLSRDQEAVIVTPTSTIGIRGSSALVLHTNGRTIAIFIAGDRLCIVVNGARSCTSRPGGVLTEDGYQGRVAPDFLAYVLGLIDGAPVVVSRGGPGTGPAVGPGQGPASPDGEEFDRQIFQDGFDADTLTGLIDGLSEPEDPTIIEEEGGVIEPPPPEIGFDPEV